jgi:hypothetical protein
MSVGACLRALRTCAGDDLLLGCMRVGRRVWRKILIVAGALKTRMVLSVVFQYNPSTHRFLNLADS